MGSGANTAAAGEESKAVAVIVFGIIQNPNIKNERPRSDVDWNGW